MVFLERHLEEFKEVLNNFLDLLDNHITRSDIKWREHGAWLAISNIGALFEHGFDDGVLRQIFKESIIRTETTMHEHPSSKKALNCALDLTMRTSELVLQRQHDKNVLAYVHILLAFLIALVDVRSLDTPVQNEYVHAILYRVPWEQLCSYTSTLANSEEFGSRFKSTSFLWLDGDASPLPEDYKLRGQVWTQTYFPGDWFQGDVIDAEEESLVERASTVRRRAERVLSLMYRLASVSGIISLFPSC